MRHLGVCLLFAVAASSTAYAQAGGPELRTDHPYFQGEGSMSTPARVIQRANTMSRGTLGATNDREKFIRLFLWRAENYSHLLSPQIYNLPGVTPNPKVDDGLMTDYDAMRTLFSYGWGVCGTNHGQLRVFADEAGWLSRRRGLNGDTGFEIFVDGGWRYCNTDQYTIHFLSNSPTAHFASVDEVVNTPHHYIEWNPDIGLGHKLPQANTHGGYADFTSVATGTVVANRSLQWRDYYNNVWAPPPGWKLYGEGFTATPVVVRLRRGETFTRWIAPGGAVTDLNLAGPIWWGYNAGNIMGGGDNTPYSRYSFVHNAPARDEVPGGVQESEGKQRYGNGCFLWQPSLAAGEHLDGAAAVTGTLTSGGSPALKSTGASTLVLSQNTPYTIAARPTGGVDPALASADGAVITANAVGTVDVEVSVNAGATWASVGALTGNGAKVDFTDSVKGRNQYLLRLTFGDGEGLDTLSLRTVTMVNQAVYPTLKSGTSQVTYSASNTGALELSPDLHTSASANSATGYVQKVADSGNANGTFFGAEPWGYVSTTNNAMSVTYKVTIPPALAAAGATWKQLFGAANCSMAVPQSGPSSTQIEISPNQTTWTKIGEFIPPTDNEFSSYWAYGRSGDGTTLGGTTYYIRVTTDNGSNPSRIRHLKFAGTYTMPASAAPVDVTYHWNNGTPQTNTHQVAAGSASDTWSITTGTVASQTKVVLSVPSMAVTPVAPTVTIPPANKTVTEGQTATFTVSVSGTAPFTYQWKKNNNPIAGATGSSYTTPATVLADSGSTYSVTVTNAQGSVTSASATLTVNPAGGGGGPATTTVFQQFLNGYQGTEDTYIDEFRPTLSFGNDQWIDIRWFTGVATEHMVGLLKFDLSSIPSTATITSAKLSMYITRTNNASAGDVLVMDKVTAPWTETHTWQMGEPAGAPSGVACPDVTTYGSQTPAPPLLYVITGMGPLVQGWVSNAATNHGVKFFCTQNINFRFASSESTTSQYCPALEITYTTGGGGGGDTTPPTMTIGSPSSGPAASSPITVTGTASDAGGVSQVTWTNALTGQNGTATGTTTWTATIPLAPGTNDITITVIDSAGNPTTQTLSMTLAGPGVTPVGGGGKSDHDSCGLGTVSPVGAPVLWFAAALGLLALIRRRG